MREMLKALEAAIAGVDCASQAGYTKPGVHIRQLLAQMRVETQDDLRRLIAKIDEASDLITNEALDRGRRHASLIC